MFKIKIWRKKSEENFQLRITCDGVLIERDEGEMDSILKRAALYHTVSSNGDPITVNLYGCTNITKSDAKSKRLTKKERKMVTLPEEPNDQKSPKITDGNAGKKPE